jgi:hypothetical protein
LLREGMRYTKLPPEVEAINNFAASLLDTES